MEYIRKRFVCAKFQRTTILQSQLFEIGPFYDLIGVLNVKKSDS